MEDYTAEMIRDMAFSFCPQCGTAIVPNHKGRPRKFCSPECRSRWNNTHPKPENWKTVRSKICPVCGREFSYRHQYGLERKYCSRACANKGRWKEGDVKNGVRLDCVFEGYEYRPEREEVRSQRLAGFECVEIAENTGLSLEQVTDYCRELGLPETGSCQLQPPDGSGNGAVQCADGFSCREGTVVGDGSVLLIAGRNITGSISLFGSRSVKTVEGSSMP